MRGIPKIQYKEQQEEVDLRDKKNGIRTVEREFYMCFCSKKYHSYSALYLHVKKVHGRSLNMKCLRVKSHQWSGSVKNVFYQFHEDDSQFDQNSERDHGQKLKVKKTQKVMKDKVKNKGRQEGEKIIKQERNSLQEKHYNFRIENSVQRILSLYKQNFQLPNQTPYSEHLINQLKVYINQNYKLFDNQAQCTNYCLDKTCEKIPFAFNYFYLSISPGPILNNELMYQLNSLGKWLYEHKYSSYLAVDARIFQEMFI